jgi:hypothetical protein
MSDITCQTCDNSVSSLPGGHINVQVELGPFVWDHLRAVSRQRSPHPHQTVLMHSSPPLYNSLLSLTVFTKFLFSHLGWYSKVSVEN